MNRAIALILLLGLTFFLMYGFLTLDGEEVPFEKNLNAMGTYISITVIDSDNDKAEKAINAAFSEIKRIDNLMSRQKEDSEIGILNSNGVLRSPSSDLLYVLEKSHYYSELSDGAFDITVLHILDLWADKVKAGSYPNHDEINETLGKVGYKKISITKNIITFEENGMKITLDGIAKGYAVDRAVDVLKNYGIKHALVNAGGDLSALGYKEDDKPWVIALQNPENKEDNIVLFKIHNESVATSGNYERYFNDVANVSHIVDPKTGFSVKGLISVTIVSEKAIDADALATAVFVLGEEKGMMLVNRLDRVDALIITSDKRILKTKGFEQREVKES